MNQTEAVLTHDEKMVKMNTEPDFIYMNRYGNSINKLLQRYPEGCPDHIIAASFEINEVELEKRFQQIISTLQIRMGV